MKKFIATSLVALFVTSCGQLNTGGSSTGGGAGSVGAGRAVVKDSSGNTVAHLVQWLDQSLALLYLPDADKYVYVETETGSYDIGEFWTNSAKPSFFFSEENCTGNVAMDDDWWGQKNKVIVSFSNRYFYISSGSTTFNFDSQSSSPTSSCTSPSTGTTTNAYLLTETTQPYNFAAIAPLNIVFE